MQTKESKLLKAEELYLQNYSLTKIENILSINRHLISKYLLSKNIKVINRQNEPRFNIHIFDIIDTEEKAYWLGFIYADGYISLTRNSMEVSLKLSDYNHLVKLKEFLNSTNDVKKDNFRCRLSVGNKYFKSIMIKKGCVPQKSLILKFPTKDIIPDILLCHFIRGYFDGDGCIHIGNTAKVIELIGTEDFLSNLLSRTELQRNKLLHDKRHNICTKRLRYNGKSSLKMLNYMYKNASIYLERKNLKYKEYCRLYEEL